MHPLTAIIAVASLVIQLLMLQHPLLISIALVTILGVLMLHKTDTMIKTTYHYAKWPMLLVLIINPIIVSLGKHVLISKTIGPFRLIISFESIFYAFAMAMKLFLIMLAFQMIKLLLNQDDLFTFMSRYCRQLTLTLSMSGNAVQTLKHEYDRVQMVMLTRGMPLETGQFMNRFKSSIYLTKVVLISVLESTFHRSEALYVRHYTKSPGSCYQPLKWKSNDQYILLLEGAILLVMAISVPCNYYQFDYYPTMNGEFKVIPFLLLFVSNMIIYKGIKEHKNDQSLSID